MLRPPAPDNGDHSTYQAALDMLDGKVKGFFLFGENPAVGSANSRLHRMAMANLDWLVVRDLVEIESASFWHDAPELETGELRTERDRDRGLSAPGRLARREERIVHEHPAPAAVALQGDRPFGRLPLRSLVRLPPRAADPREALAARMTPATRPILDLEWHYPTEGPLEDPSADAVLREISGWDADRARQSRASPS